MRTIKVLFVLFLIGTVGFKSAEYICDKLHIDFFDIDLGDDELL